VYESLIFDYVHSEYDCTFSAVAININSGKLHANIVYVYSKGNVSRNLVIHKEVYLRNCKLHLPLLTSAAYLPSILRAWMIAYDL
jgi:hypothetical protein